MNSAGIAFALSLLACPALAQIVVTATGTLTLNGSTMSAPVSAAVNPLTNTVLSVGSTGRSASLTLGATTTLTLATGSLPFNPGHWSSAGGDVTVAFAAAVPVAGVLRLQLPPSCFPPGYTSPMIDVDLDGLVEMTPSTVPVDVPVVLGIHPVPVRISALALAFAVGCTGTASVTFLPQPANLQTVLPPCGPAISASLRRANVFADRLRLRIGNMNGLAGVFFVGTVPTGPGSVCGPASNADASLLIAPSPAGVTVDLPLSPALIGTNRLQYVELTLPFQLWWSNAVQLTLP